MYTALCIILGYVLGSIPFALVIGKVFYKTDVRQHGSGNLGGSNTGRVLGSKAGAAVILLDILKVVLAMWIASHVSAAAAIWTGLACCVGHCFPLFAHFRGGKAVATAFGFLVGISAFVFRDPWFFFAPLVMFLIMLWLYKFVSVASIAAILCSSLLITVLCWDMNAQSIMIITASWLMSILVIWRHWGNIQRVREGSETAVTWL
ncbi:glycerol-3-phosphate 1-O-acyltransferase PlsY [Faecalibaculum rodentium]|uniref:glycerol-3-phosphate 1-O-acyltransferase PlsY n=1 Tax=Faecalibaculum rodentium TaxID=1702221 RepID=UPI00258CB20C|nr:glycerol-3-phosphate 1-O-acyltransferase PlsY [Faecalibaculum rodentium]